MGNAAYRRARKRRNASFSLVLPQLATQMFQGLIFAVAVKVSFQAPEGNTDHVAVVQTRAESVTEPQPQLVQTVQVLGPKGPRFTYTEGRPGLMTSSEKE